jgi:hypothetical protein
VGGKTKGQGLQEGYGIQSTAKGSCRDQELSGMMATWRHAFFSGASIMRTPSKRKVAGSIPCESDIGI